MRSRPFTAPARSAIPIVVATVFVDVIGFGMILPLLPSYAARLGGSPAAIGLLVAIPAVVAFNYFSRRLKVVMGGADEMAHAVLASAYTAAHARAAAEQR